jgi:ribosomal protein L11 methyltransferase
MIYSEVLVNVTSNEDFHKDLLINALSEIGFDTFEDLDNGFKAYIPSSALNLEALEQLKKTFEQMFSFSFTTQSIPHQNWNEIWESNFEPLQVANRCYIRATFHEPQPQFEYEIIIDPKMAFGTGHHQTTALMMEFMLAENFSGQKVLDMGCGTGILAILASKMGAKEVLAIDYDDVCFDSTLENALLNKTNNIEALCGSKEVIPNQKFDIILANINRNILLDQLDTYSVASKYETKLFLSGFYEDPDLEIIKKKCDSIGFKYNGHKVLNAWVSAKFVFSNK